MGSFDENAHKASNNGSPKRNWTAGGRRRDTQPHSLHLNAKLFLAVKSNDVINDIPS